MATRSIVGYTALDRSVADLAGVPDPTARPDAAADYLVPQRRDHSALGLQLEGTLDEQERRADDPVALADPTTHLLERTRLGTDYVDASQAPFPSVIQRTADALLQDARQVPQLCAPRLGSASGPVGNYSRFAPVANPQNADQKFRDFFRAEEEGGGEEEDDPLPLDDPATWGMFRSVVQRDAVERARHEDVAHPPSKTLVTRKTMQEARLPPRKGQPTCAQGPLCMFRRHPEWGYTGRVFEPARNGLCVECTLWAYKCRAQAVLDDGAPPPRDINEFVVMAGVGEYDPKALLRNDDGRRKTGIAGRVPEYHGSKRTWMKIPDHFLALYDNDTGPRPTYFLAETEVDFH